MRERYRKEKTQSDSAISVQISRAEQEVEERWQAKADRMVSQAEDRWRRKYDELKEELRESNNNYNQAVAKVINICCATRFINICLYLLNTRLRC